MHARIIASLILAGLVSHCASAQDPDAVKALFPEGAPRTAAEPVLVATPAVAPEESIPKIQQRLDALEARLGPAGRPPSLANNMERRLADLETRVQKLEQRVARFQQYDQRIRRLEME